MFFLFHILMTNAVSNQVHLKSSTGTPVKILHYTFSRTLDFLIRIKECHHGIQQTEKKSNVEAESIQFSVSRSVALNLDCYFQRQENEITEEKSLRRATYFTHILFIFKIGIDFKCYVPFQQCEKIYRSTARATSTRLR